MVSLCLIIDRRLLPDFASGDGKILVNNNPVSQLGSSDNESKVAIYEPAKIASSGIVSRGTRGFVKYFAEKTSIRLNADTTIEIKNVSPEDHPTVLCLLQDLTDELLCECILETCSFTKYSLFDWDWAVHVGSDKLLRRDQLVSLLKQDVEGQRNVISDSCKNRLIPHLQQKMSFSLRTSLLKDDSLLGAFFGTVWKTKMPAEVLACFEANLVSDLSEASKSRVLLEVPQELYDVMDVCRFAVVYSHNSTIDKTRRVEMHRLSSEAEFKQAVSMAKIIESNPKARKRLIANANVAQLVVLVLSLEATPEEIPLISIHTSAEERLTQARSLAQATRWIEEKSRPVNKLLHTSEDIIRSLSLEECISTFEGIFSLADIFQIHFGNGSSLKFLKAADVASKYLRGLPSEDQSKSGLLLSRLLLDQKPGPDDIAHILTKTSFNPDGIGSPLFVFSFADLGILNQAVSWACRSSIQNLFERIDWEHLQVDYSVKWMTLILEVADKWLSQFPAWIKQTSTRSARKNENAFLHLSSFIRRLIKSSSNTLRDILPPAAADKLTEIRRLVVFEDVATKILQLACSSEASSNDLSLLYPFIDSIELDFIHFVIAGQQKIPQNRATIFDEWALLESWRGQLWHTANGDEPAVNVQHVIDLLAGLGQKSTASKLLIEFSKKFLDKDAQGDLLERLEVLRIDMIPPRPSNPLADAIHNAITCFSNPLTSSILYKRRFDVLTSTSVASQSVHPVDTFLARVPECLDDCHQKLQLALRSDYPACVADELYGRKSLSDLETQGENAAMEAKILLTAVSDETISDKEAKVSRLVRLGFVDRKLLKQATADVLDICLSICPPNDSNAFLASLQQYAKISDFGTLPFFSSDSNSIDELVAIFEKNLSKSSQAWSRSRFIRQHGKNFKSLLDSLNKRDATRLAQELDMLRVRFLQNAALTSGLAAFTELSISLQRLAEIHKSGGGLLTKEFLGGLGRVLEEESVSRIGPDVFSVPAFVQELESVGKSWAHAIEVNSVALESYEIKIVLLEGGSVDIRLVTEKSFQLSGTLLKSSLTGVERINDFIAECFVLIFTHRATNESNNVAKTLETRLNALRANLELAESALLSIKSAIRFKIHESEPDLKLAYQKLATSVHQHDHQDVVIGTFKQASLRSDIDKFKKRFNPHVTEWTQKLNCIRYTLPFLNQVDDQQLHEFIRSNGRGPSWIKRLIELVATSVDSSPLNPDPDKFLGGRQTLDACRSSWEPAWNQALANKHLVSPKPSNLRMRTLTVVEASEYVDFHGWFYSESCMSSAQSVQLSAMSALMLENSTFSQSSIWGLIERLKCACRILQDSLNSNGRDIRVLVDQVRFHLGVCDGLVVAGVQDLSEEDARNVVSAASTYGSLCDAIISTHSVATYDTVHQFPVLVFVARTEVQVRGLVNEGFVEWSQPLDSGKLKPSNSVGLRVIKDSIRAKGPICLALEPEMKGRKRLLVGRTATPSSIAVAYNGLLSDLSRVQGAHELILDLCSLEKEMTAENFGIFFCLLSFLCFGHIGQGTLIAQSIDPSIKLVSLEILESQYDAVLGQFGWCLADFGDNVCPAPATYMGEANQLPKRFSDENVAKCIEALDQLIASSSAGSAASDEAIIGALRFMRGGALSGERDSAKPIIPFTYTTRTLEMIREMVRRTAHWPYPQCILLAGDTGVGKSYVAQKFCELLQRSGFPFNYAYHVLYTFHASFDAGTIKRIASEIGSHCVDGKYTMPVLDEITASPAQSELDRLLLQRMFDNGDTNLESTKTFLGDQGLVPLATCNPTSSAMDFVFALPPTMNQIAINVPAPSEEEMLRFLADQLTKDVRGPKFQEVGEEGELLRYIIVAFKECKAVLANQDWRMGPITPRSAVLFASLIQDFLKLTELLRISKDSLQERRITAVLMALYVYFGVRTVPRRLFYEKLESLPSPTGYELPESMSVQSLIENFRGKVVALYPGASTYVQTQAFTENVLCITLALLSRKPLLILGRDAVSSKTSAVGLCTAAMQGKYSTSEDLRAFPAIQSFRLQMSATSTATDVNSLRNGVFNLVLQKNANQKDIGPVPAVIIEELSMMNRLGAHAPIRAFHALLDQHQTTHARQASKFGSGANDFAFIATSNFDKGKHGELPIGEPLANRMLIVCHEDPSKEERFQLCWQCAVPPNFDATQNPNDLLELQTAVRNVSSSENISIRSAICFARSAVFVYMSNQGRMRDALEISRASHLRTVASGEVNEMMTSPGNQEAHKLNNSVLGYAMAKGAPRRALLVAYDTLEELVDMWERVSKEYEKHFPKRPSMFLPVTETGSHSRTSQLETLVKIRFGCEGGSLMGILNPIPIMHQIHALLNDFNTASSSILVRKCFDVCQIMESSRIVLFVHRSRVSELHEAILSRVSFINALPWSSSDSQKRQEPKRETMLQCLQDLVSADEAPDDDPAVCRAVSRINQCQSRVDSVVQRIANDSERKESIIAMVRGTVHSSFEFVRFKPEDGLEQFLDALNKSRTSAPIRKLNSCLTLINMMDCNDEQLARNLTLLGFVGGKKDPNTKDAKFGEQFVFCLKPDHERFFSSLPQTFRQFRIVDCLEGDPQYAKWASSLGQILIDPIGELEKPIAEMINTQVSLWLKHDQAENAQRNHSDLEKSMCEWVRTIVWRGLSELLSEPKRKERARWLLKGVEKLPRRYSARSMLIEHIKRSVNVALTLVVSRLTFPIGSRESLDAIFACVNSGAFPAWRQQEQEIGDLSSSLDPYWGMMSIPMSSSSEKEIFPLFDDLVSLYQRNSTTQAEIIPGLDSLTDDQVTMLGKTFFKHRQNWMDQDDFDDGIATIIVNYFLPSLTGTSRSWIEVLRALFLHESWLLVGITLAVSGQCNGEEPGQQQPPDVAVSRILQETFSRLSQPTSVILDPRSQFFTGLRGTLAARRNHSTFESDFLFSRVWLDLLPRNQMTKEDAVESYHVCRVLFGFAEVDEAFEESFPRLVTGMMAKQELYAQFLGDLELTGVYFVASFATGAARRCDHLLHFLGRLLKIDSSPVVERLLSRVLEEMLSCELHADLMSFLEHLTKEEHVERPSSLLLCIRAALLAAVSKIRLEQRFLAAMFALKWCVDHAPNSGLVDYCVALAYLPLICDRVRDFDRNNLEILSPFLQLRSEPAIRHHFVRVMVSKVDEADFHRLRPLGEALGEWFEGFCVPIDEATKRDWLAEAPPRVAGQGLDQPLISRLLPEMLQEDSLRERLSSERMAFCRLVATVWAAALYRKGPASPLLAACKSSLADASLANHYFPAMERSPVELCRELGLVSSLNRCQCGYIYGIGECGLPGSGQGTRLACPSCKKPLGGQGHVFDAPTERLANQSFPIEGVPLTWFVLGDAAKERNLTPIEYRILSVLTIVALAVFGNATQFEARVDQLVKHWDMCKRVCDMGSDAAMQELLCFLLTRNSPQVLDELLMVGNNFKGSPSESQRLRSSAEATFKQGFHASLLSKVGQNWNGAGESQVNTLRRVVQELERELDQAHPLKNVRDAAITRLYPNEEDRQRNFATRFFKGSGRETGADEHVKVILDEMQRFLLLDINSATNETTGEVDALYDRYSILFRLMLVQSSSTNLDKLEISPLLRPRQAAHLGLTKFVRLHSYLGIVSRVLDAVNRYATQNYSLRGLASAKQLVEAALAGDRVMIEKFEETWNVLRMDNDFECQKANFPELDNLPVTDIIAFPGVENETNTPARVILNNLVAAQDAELSSILGRQFATCECLSALDFSQIDSSGALIDWKRVEANLHAFLPSLLMDADKGITHDFMESLDMALWGVIKTEFRPKRLVMNGWDAPAVSMTGGDTQRPFLSLAHLVPQESLPSVLEAQLQSSRLNRELLHEFMEWLQIEVVKLRRNAVTASSRELGDAPKQMRKNSTVDFSLIKAKHLDALQRWCLNQLELQIEEDLPPEFRVNLAADERDGMLQMLRPQSRTTLKTYLEMLQEIVAFLLENPGIAGKRKTLGLEKMFEPFPLLTKFSLTEKAEFWTAFGSLKVEFLIQTVKLVRMLMAMKRDSSLTSSSNTTFG